MTNYKYGPAYNYKHNHPPVRNVNHIFQERLTVGQRVADRFAKVMGSWPFIIIQSLIIFVWIGVNVFLVIKLKSDPAYLKSWDPYPFILLNLVLSLQAAYTGPVVMMSQNRQAYKDRMSAEEDYNINQKAEKEIEIILQHLVHHDELMRDILLRIDNIEPVQKLRTSDTNI